MTQKEKAQRYDEAIERANSLLSSNELGNAWIYKLLPELKESEDERIKNEIIQFLLLPHPQFVGNRNYEKWIAWLEKQGEQPTLPKWKYKKDHNPLTSDSITLNKYGCVAKSPSGALVSDVWILDFDDLAKLPKEEIEKQSKQKLTPIFRIGDTIIAKDGSYIEKELFHIDKIEDDCYWDGENTILVCNQDEFEIFKQKLVNRTKPRFKVGDWIIFNGSIYYVKEVVKGSYRIVSKDGITCRYAWNIDIAAGLWTIEDARDGDVLYSLDSNQPFIYKERKAYEQAKAYCGLNIYGKFFVWATKDCIITTDKYIPATKEQRDTLMKAMADARYEWDANKKELKKIEQNLTVTDEELAKAKKDAYNDALDKNECHSGEPTFDDGWSAAIWYLKKRNALPQNTWRPSATDMKVLEDVIDLHVNPINYHATLHSILEQLKKLREE